MSEALKRWRQFITTAAFLFSAWFTWYNIRTLLIGVNSFSHFVWVMRESCYRRVAVLACWSVTISLLARYNDRERLASITKRISGLLCMLIALFFGAMGILYIVGDITLSQKIKAGYTAYAEGPGLGFAIGAGVLTCVTLPLSILGIFLLKYDRNSRPGNF